jgi:protein-tyrosine phosphatase
MRQILPHSLWLGHAGDGTNFRRIFELGIRAIVQLAVEEPPVRPPRELIFYRFPLLDGPGNDPGLLTLAFSSLATLVERRVPTLVCCGAGLSRSPAVAAAALSLVLHAAPEECLRRVTEHHPADVAPGFWQEVSKLCDFGGTFGNTDRK